MNNKIFQKVKNTAFALVLALGLLVPASITLAMPQKAEPVARDVSQGIPTDRIIIKYKDGTSALSEPDTAAQMESLSATAGVTLEYVRAMSDDANVLQLPERLPVAQVQAISDQLMTLPDVEYAEPDRILRHTLIPNDPGFASPGIDNDGDPLTANVYQWDFSATSGGIYGINAPAAWDITKGSASTVVAVIDTGITNHEDLAGRTVPGYDFISDVPTANDGDGRDADAHDPGDWITAAEDANASGPFTDCGDVPGLDTPSSWHGTHVAGTIGAAGNNSVGVAGINWFAKILPVRVLGKCGGYTSDIVDGMRWAAGLSVSGVPANSNPAKVLNLSLGGPGKCSASEQNAINAITAVGAVVVVAAGNSNVDLANVGTDENPASSSPANCNGVITVAATDALGQRADYSNYGSAVEISAPGGGNGQGDILSTSNIGETTPSGSGIYVGMDGTSMAAPHVSGVVSLMFAVNPRITPDQVLAILQKTAQAFPNGSTCTTSTCGSGILDAGEAVRIANLPDLVITGVTLSKTYPSITDTFDVNITIKNQGGLNADGNSVAYRSVYSDRDPLHPSLLVGNQGCLDSNVGTEGTDVFTRINNNASIPSGESTTLPVTIPAGVFEGMHQLYAYADADCNVAEGFEDNNGYAPVTINPFTPGALTYPEQGQNIGTDYNPKYQWYEVDTVDKVTKYGVYVTGPSGAVFYQTYDASLICGTINGAGSDSCSVTGGPSATLGGGNYSWYIYPYRPTGGWGPWSAQTNFSTTIPTAPAAAALISPANAATLNTNYNPTYTWSKVAGATYYEVYVAGPGGAVALNQWYTASSICDVVTVGECSVVSPTLGGGTYTWGVLTYGPTGSGPWASWRTFSTATTPPAAAGLLSPANAATLNTNYNPTYTWSKVAGAIYYQVYVAGPGGAVALNQWYTASSICDVVTVGECSVVSPTLGGGTYTWGVLTYGPTGYGPWASWRTFSTATTPPAAAVLLSPANAAALNTNYNPTYTWSKVAGAIYYQVYVAGPGGAVALNQWYTASSICDVVTVGECSVVSPTLGGGTYTWGVLTYGPTGYGPWASWRTFSTATTPPAAAALISPANAAALNTNYNPTYTWSKVAGATYYEVYVAGPGGAVALNQWYTASSICDVVTVGECSVVSPTLGGGTYTWGVLTYGPTGSGPWASWRTFSTATTPPAAAGLLSPANAAALNTNYNPTYTWSKVAGAIYYQVYVAGPGGAVALNQWYTASSICDVVTVGECSVVSPTLGGGTYTWGVLTYGPTGYGPWASWRTFSTATTPPAAAVLIDPMDPLHNAANIGTEYNPTYTWSKAAGATYYYLYVSSPSGVVLNQWYKSSDICNDVDNNCKVTSPSLGGGSYSWLVWTYGPTGYGSWSNNGQPVNFYTDALTIPKAATNLLPTGTILTSTPSYTWNKVSGASWYHLYIKGSSGLIKDQWYQGVSICSGGLCSASGPTLARGDYIWWVQTYNVLGYGPWKKSTFTVSP